MSMSKDRVKFEIGGNHSMSGSWRSAYYQAFGCEMPNFEDTLTVICRPSQFARFLIYRDQAGGRNGFKELNAVLFHPHQETVKVVDVSTNPHSTGC